LTVRNRTAVAVGASGTYYKYFFGTVDNGTTNCPGVSASCTDVVGNYPFDNPLTINKTTWSIAPVSSYQATGGYFVLDLRDYCPALYRTLTMGHLVLPSLSDAADATKVFARTNPSRATVDAVAAVGELRELPSFLFQTGKAMIRNGVRNTFRFDKGFVIGDLKVVPKGVANGYLAWEYGWKPFISDLKKLLDFQRHVLARETELRKLHGKGGLSRTFQVSTDSAESISTNTFVESSLFTMYSTEYKIRSVRRRWGTAKWLPDLASHPVTDLELHRQAVRAVYGLSLSPRTAWELIPWSWLIDWCSDVGDYLEANRNTVGATCAGANLMTHTKTTHTFRKMVHNLPGSAKGGEATCVVETKLRGPFSSPVLFSDIPNLDFRKTSILGALGIQRTRGIPNSRIIHR